MMALAVNPGDPDNVFAMGYYNSANRLYFTEDGGTTWNERTMTGFQGTAYDIVVHPDSPNRIAAATSTGLFATADGGVTWTRVTTAFNGAWCVQTMQDSGDLLTGTNANGAWIWEDWAGTPQQMGTGMTNTRVNLFIQAPEACFVYAGTQGNSVWRSYYGTAVDETAEAVLNQTGFTLCSNPITTGAAAFIIPESQAARIQIFDLSGRQVIEHTPETAAQQTTVDVSSLPSGAYIARFTSDTQTSVTRMVITR